MMIRVNNANSEQKKTKIQRNKKMASSRWRRFAFFERNVYELPDEVYEDVIPTVSSTSSAGVGLQQTNKSSSDNKTGVASSSSSAKSSSNNNNNQTVLTPSILFHDEDQYLNDGRGYSASNSSGDHYNNSNNSPYPPISEYFSQCNVAVKLIPSANASSQTSIISHTRKNPTTVARSSTSTSTTSTKRINNNGIVSLSPVLDETGKTTFVYKDSSNININSSNQISNSSTPSKDTIWNVPVGSELVLLFIASRNSQYIHIIDLTMRCNPVGANKSAYMSTSATVTNNSSNANLSSSTAPSGRKKNSEVGIVVEKEEKQGDETNNNGNNGNTSNMINTDSDGWRGYLYPFQYGFVSGGVKSSATFSSSVLNRNRARTHQCKGRIVGMATDIQNPHPTSVSNINSNHNTNNRTQQHVHLAVITDHQDSVGITVLIDPHLHLYIPPTSTSTSSTTANNKKTTVDLTLHPFSPSSTIPMTIFQPSSGFDFNYRGRPRCVDIITSHNAHPPHTHFVAVGTDNGLVILYSYIFNPPKANNNSTSSENENNNSTNQDGTTAGATGGGVGGGGINPNNKLTVLQEIPPPFVAGTGNSGVGSGGGSSTNDTNNNSVRYSVTSLRFSKKDQLFVSYKRTFPSSSNNNNSFSSSSQKQQQQSQRDNTNNQASSSLNANTMRPTGVCCYNLSKSGKSVASRFDLDGRDVRGGNAVCDLLKTTTSSSSNNSSARTTSSSISNSDNKKKEEEESGKFIIARSDGLYLYSSKDGRNGVAPIEGSKISMCCIPSLPPSISGERDIIKNYNQFNNTSSSSTSEEEKKEDSPSTSTNSNNNNNSGLSNYVLIAAKDAKSGRDAVDIYDPNNKLVAFHVLLSPGHKALQSSAVTSKLDNSLYHPTLQYDDALVGNHHQNNLYGGRSSAIVMTSGGAIVILTERSTTEKVSLLTQKNLFKAAITLAYRDPSYPISSIVSLYRRHAEHLFRKGDYESAMNQYIYTIGSIEPSHVIYRFLDAPKIPLLAKYLEALREKELATDIHLDLLRTCYLKLNETEKAESVGMLVEQMSSSNNNNNNFGSDSSSFQRSSSSFSSLTTRGYSSILANLTHNPTESLAIVCSLEGPRVSFLLMFSCTKIKLLNYR